jgi:membrane protein implicated in regulation of membrane protease activity
MINDTAMTFNAECRRNKVSIVKSPMSLPARYAGMDAEIVREKKFGEYLVRLDGELWWVRACDIDRGGAGR